MKSRLQATIAEPVLSQASKDAPASENRLLALARGMARLYEQSIALFEESLISGQFKLKIRIILSFHKAAYSEIDANAGKLRQAPVFIGNSSHVPPDASLLPILLEEMCEYVNENWNLRSSLHLSAFVLWRLLWIHPFTEGNGTIARALSYVVLMAREGQFIPGEMTISEQIAADRASYYEALEAADRAWSEGSLDVSALETLLGAMLEAQLKS